MDFSVLILGSDINAYTMARCYHEKYGKCVDLIGRIPMLVTSSSKFCNLVYEKDLQNPKKFLSILENYAKEKKYKKIILVGTNDHYINLIADNEKVLKKWYLFNYPSKEITSTFLDKALFYKKYSSVFDMPKTFVYSLSDKVELKLTDFSYPLILKPADGHTYYELSFEGQNKVFKVEDEKSLKSVINLLKINGYTKDLIIQEFIEGDDSMLFDSMFYVNSKGKAEHASFAQIALQEHTKTGVGNCTVLLNGYSEFEGVDELVLKLKNFLQEVGYSGFAEFDFKYDKKDDKFKLFEINPRQARCSYYFSVVSKNLIECLVDDLIYNKESSFALSKKIVLLSFVPKSIIYKEVKNKVLLAEIKKAIKNKKLVNSLDYSKDNGLRRKMFLIGKSINYQKKYNNKNWWN